MSAYLNQKEISDSKFDSLTRSYVKNKYTHGVFETMLIDKSHGMHLKKRHLERLLRGIQSLKLKSKVFREIDVNSFTEYFEADTSFFISEFFKNQNKAVVIRYQIILDEKNPKIINRMLKCRSVTPLKSSGVKIKICNTTLSQDETQQGRKDIDRRVYEKAYKELDNKFYDGILCNKYGQVIEGIKTNIFAIKENNLYTPSLSLGGVAGIMRQVFIETAQKARLNVLIAPIHYLDLLKMDAVFLTNSIVGVVNVDYILRPHRKRSLKILNAQSAGFQNILALNIIKNSHHYKRIRS